MLLKPATLVINVREESFKSELVNEEILVLPSYHVNESIFASTKLATKVTPTQLVALDNTGLLGPEIILTGVLALSQLLAET